MWNICQNGFLLYYCYCQNEIKLIQCVKSQEKKPSVTQQGSCVSLLAEPAVPTAQEDLSFVMELKIVVSPCWCLASTREESSKVGIQVFHRPRDWIFQPMGPNSQAHMSEE